MARPMTSVAVGRVNRRFLFLALILATLSGILAYAALSQQGGEGTSSGGNISVIVATESIDGGATITAAMLEETALPQDAVGEGPVTEIDTAVGKVARFPIRAGEPLLQGDITGGVVSNDVLSHLIEARQRGMAIEVNAVIGGGGLILPGDHVDVFWIPNDPLDDVPGGQLLAENVEVLAVEQTLVELPPTVSEGTPEAPQTPGGDERVRGGEAEPVPSAATVTLMLTPPQVQNVFCGDEAGTIRLAVRQFGDDSPSGLVPVGCIVQGRNSR